jgi:hypothetical protein
LAFTSGLSDAGSDSEFGIQIQLNGDVRALTFLDRPGNDFQSNKGDMWDFVFSSFGFHESCMKILEIERVSIFQSGTLVGDLSNNYQVLTHDFNVNHWIDGNSADSEHRRFDLNFAGTITSYIPSKACRHACLHGSIIM